MRLQADDTSKLISNLAKCWMNLVRSRLNSNLSLQFAITTSFRDVNLIRNMKSWKHRTPNVRRRGIAVSIRGNESNGI